jgi:hypothetical protein
VLHAQECDWVPEGLARDGWCVARAVDKSAVSSLWCAQLQRDLYSLGLGDSWRHPADVELLPDLSCWKETVRFAVAVREEACWRRKMDAKLSSGRSGDHACLVFGGAPPWLE